MATQGSATMFDLVVQAGRVIDPSRSLDGQGWVGIRGDRIETTIIDGDDGRPWNPSASATLDFPDGVLLPGLVDMHAHPAIENSKYGIEPDTHILVRGATTVLSQGDAGARHWPHYRTNLINRSKTRVRLAINLSTSGESKAKHSLGDLADADVAACSDAIRDGGDLIWGIAVNTAEPVLGNSDPREILQRAIQVGENTSRPLLVGTRHAPDFPLDELLGQLRSGDVITYCFHGMSDRIEQDGHVLDCVWQARERGVLFDIGHGMGSFDFDVAEAVIRDGFLPDTISTDQYRRHVGSRPQHDLPLTVSKLLAAGMEDNDVWPRVTNRPAELLGLGGEIGTLQPGACADLVVLTQTPVAIPLQDVNGNERTGPAWTATAVVRGGEVIVSGSA